MRVAEGPAAFRNSYRSRVLESASHTQSALAIVNRQPALQGGGSGSFWAVQQLNVDIAFGGGASKTDSLALLLGIF